MKITYPHKTNDESAPENQRKFLADEANEIKRVVNNNATDIIEFTPLVELNKNYVSEHTVTGPIEYVVSNKESMVLGSTRIDYHMADGVNIPTFSSDFKIRFNNYLNEPYRINRILFEYVGHNTILVDITYV